MSADMSAATDAAWAQLEEHFQHHASLLKRFKNALPVTVICLWHAGTNERGENLSPLERSALVERYCELFGDWPPEASESHVRSVRRLFGVCVPQRAGKPPI